MEPKHTASAYWNDRYAGEEYVYGVRPNAHFKAVIDAMEPGRLLLPAEGEGRNAVYAAGLGWTVHAFDFSPEGQQKGEQLARREGVTITYDLDNFLTYDTSMRYDLIGLIFTHFGPRDRKVAFRRYVEFLKPDGFLVAEFFHPDQLGRVSGGPKQRDWLVTPTELADIFSELETLILETREVELDEGPFHRGPAVVTRYLGGRAERP